MQLLIDVIISLYYNLGHTVIDLAIIFIRFDILSGNKVTLLSLNGKEHEPLGCKQDISVAKLTKQLYLKPKVS